MEKLKLEYLDFANNAKVRLIREPHWDFKEVNLQDCELGFNSSNKEPYLRYKDVTFGLDQMKLYRRPLSDLTKEIEHDGEKFVPIEKLDWDTNRYRRRKSGEYPIIFNETFSTCQELLEWHFNIFNIPEELCIPY
jgi:hypothetical protein